MVQPPSKGKEASHAVTFNRDPILSSSTSKSSSNSASTISPSPSPSSSSTPSGYHSPNIESSSNFKVNVSSPRSSISSASTATQATANASSARRGAWRGGSIGAGGSSSSSSNNPSPSASLSSTTSPNNQISADSDSGTSQSSSEKLSGSLALETTTSSSSVGSTSTSIGSAESSSQTSQSQSDQSRMDLEKIGPSHIQVGSSSSSNSKNVPPHHPSSSPLSSEQPTHSNSHTTLTQEQLSLSWDRVSGPSYQQSPPGTISQIPPFGSPTSLAPILVSEGGTSGPVLRRGQSQVMAVGGGGGGRTGTFENWNLGSADRRNQEDSPSERGWKGATSSSARPGSAHSSSPFNSSNQDLSSQKSPLSRSQPLEAQLPPQAPTSSQSPLSQSTSSRLNTTTSTSSDPKMEGDGYDWANFVFAYSRGRWDPNRLPRPPGRSTAHPGNLTRIEPNGGVTLTTAGSIVGTSSGLSGEPSVQELVDSCGKKGALAQAGENGGSEPEVEAMRRPSLTYVQADGTLVPDSAFLPASSKSSPPDPSQVVDSSENGGIASLSPQSSSSHPTLRKFSSLPQDTDATSSQQLHPQPDALVDVYQHDLAHARSSHSSPNALATTHAAILAQEARENLLSGNRTHEGTSGNGNGIGTGAGNGARGSKSSPDGLPTFGTTRQPLTTRTSDPSHLVEGSIWHTPRESSASQDRSEEQGAKEGSSPLSRPHLSASSSSSAFHPLAGSSRGPSNTLSAPASSQSQATTTELRPALLTQFSALSLGSNGSGSDHTNVTIHASDSSPPSRPGPTPVQDPTSESSSEALAMMSPVSTRSAPEVPLSGMAAILRRTSDAEDRERVANDDPRNSALSVAALRRAAARRTSVTKELSSRRESSEKGKGKQVLHSSSFPGSVPSSVSGEASSDASTSNDFLFQSSSPASSAQVSSYRDADQQKTEAAASQSIRRSGSNSTELADSNGGAKGAAGPSNESRRKALEAIRAPSSPISSRPRTTSELQRQPSGGGAGVEGRNGNGNSISASPTSPAIKSYMAAGQRTENFYKEFGYLPSILPPNELERRQALRRYGPPKVAANVNFDRIAHLVKLVFNTKLVLISLVGENEQIFQTEMGGGGNMSLPSLQKSAGARDCSFCAHSILQDGDEPILVLDTWRDWRFAGNPLVLGSPHIRFYCGAPLRTADGFNLGSLCIIDDKPWTEFNPRQRHTLKEFARVVMREMELMRDQIQLGMRDRMQNSIELFTRECLEVESEDVQDSALSAHGGESTTGSTGANPVGLHRVYDLAAKSMQVALQASGAILFDLSHFELVDSSAHEGGSGGKIFFPSPYSDPDAGPVASFDEPSNVEASVTGEGAKPTESASKRAENLKGKTVPPMLILGASEDTEFPPERETPVPLSHHIKVAEFLRSHRTGHYFPFCPSPFSQLLPSGVTNLMLVPIFGLNKQPFALLCAYSQGTESGTTLEELKDSGLQYLRALGMIILSAVLKKDIMLADKAKSHFISNISHELRTPLHGILAAAELLSETKLDATQDSYLETVEACGKSLLELVNHVLDFTKLSGGASVDRQHSRTKCDLVKLVQEVCESSWIGQMAKTLESQSGIGSVYAPPSSGATPARGSLGDGSSAKKLRALPVETVIDVSMRKSGWLVNCDTGGIRRVLMNLIGNSLKFTSKGFVHVAVREVQSSDTHVIVELGVTDTGRGISRAFLEEQLFHPFTQENTLGTGTGLGLSIVNSIVQSPSINGKIDVWSTVGQGTEIRVTCELELCSADEAEGAIYQPALDVQKERTVGFLGFDGSRGHENLREVLCGYFEDWWNFSQVQLEGNQLELLASQEAELGDLVLINESVALLEALGKRNSPLPPAIILTSVRGDPEVAAACDAYHREGGVARMLFKPAGPAKIEAVVDFCLQCLDRIQRGDPPASEHTAPSSRLPSPLPSPAAAEFQAGGYFHPKESTLASDEQEGDTPREPSLKTPVPDLTTPRLSRPNNETVAKLRESSHHMSPEAPPDLSSTLIRRHSTEDRVMQVRSGGIVMESQNSTDPTSHSYSRLSRPMLPARSITYHEPRLNKHVLVSPHGSNPLSSGGSSSSRKRSGGSGLEEEQDYFSRTVGEQSNPGSPGSQISLDGGDGAVLKSALSPTRNAPSSSNAPQKRMQILSVEDNAINRRVIAAFLSKMEVDFVEASNGEEGVKIFESHPANHFDVILMDLSMPILDGIGATAAIRKIESERFEASTSADRRTSGRKGSASSFASSISSRSATQSQKPRAKIFALTGRSSEEDKRKALATGADGYMVKPLGFKVLSSLLKMLAH